MKTVSSPDILFRLAGKAHLDDLLLQHRQNTRALSLKTVAGSLKALLTAQLWKAAKGQYLIVCSDTEQAENWLSDLQQLLGNSSLCLFAESEKRIALSAEQLDTQLIGLTHALTVITGNEHAIIIATADSFAYQVPPPKAMQNNILELRRGGEIPFDEFITLLSLNGFNRKDFVETVGDLAVRGGIVDVFPPGMDNPLRIEFFGDEIDSIREFDPLSQRSIGERDSISIVTHVFHNEEHHIDATLLDYLLPDTTVIMDSPESISARLAALEITGVEERLAHYRMLALNPLGTTTLSLSSRAQPVFQSSISRLCSEMRQLAQQEYTIILCADGNEQLRRLTDLIEGGLDACADEEESHTSVASVEETLRRIVLLPFTLSEGFILPEAKFALLTEHQIFMRRKAKVIRKSTAKGITLRELHQLRPGDFVVHVDKGIAQFDGLETITVGGNEQESVRLIFAGGDKMYLHMNYINRLQKYSAQEGVSPTLSRLGTKDWERKKERTKKRIKDIARDLIRLYAQRKMQQGMAFPADTLWQKELEASFMYEDTPDQARATSEVKADMEQEAPMDRLVCGDVGFGKTEVAIRAAFKAVQAGKQVAVLVPTTILAEQHYSSFRDRLDRYAVNVDVISRFRTKAEQKEIVERTKEGKVDILIGTHRLLSKDVAFRDLGLLVVDEEQRFGVGAKEKLRQARVSVDTLTLTATPIPRTLNFSLMGARDISVIETPPRNRIPIHTEILPWNEKVLTDAIERELERGGQIFFVNDRISDLELLGVKLQELVPSLRIAIAHGGMEPEELETVMERFMERKSDVLIATKIIESGIDIPNVNTMFINRAQSFGLAELYQLRGRVGRSNVQAYCYLLIPSVHSLPRTALRRLQAIEEFTELGSGFNLAMRDLEIRGAGNLLGGEQSGFIADIGFELFQKILDEAVQELKQEEFSDLFSKDTPQQKLDALFENEDVAIDMEGDALLPKSYIQNDVERYEFYKKLYVTQTEADIQPIVDEMRDRFGALPQSATRLLDVVRLRIAALPTGLSRISLEKDILEVEFPGDDAKRFYEHVFQPMITVIASMPKSKIVPKGKKVYARFEAMSVDEAITILRYLTEATRREIQKIT